MIHSQQMQDPVKHENAYLLLKRVAAFGRLPAGLRRTDGQFAESGWGAARNSGAGKREHVGRHILAAEFPVQAAQLGVLGDEACEIAAGQKFVAQTERKRA